MHKELFKLIKKFDSNYIKWMMSNAKTKLVLDAFSEYTYEDIEARRAIHCKKPIQNYGTTCEELSI